MKRFSLILKKTIVGTMVILSIRDGVSVDYATAQVVREQTQKSLQQLIGFYRFPNRVAFIQFYMEGDRLMAKQVWDQRIYPLTQMNAITFVSEKERYRVVFDSATAPRRATILNRVALQRVDFDPANTGIFNAEQTKTFVGRYAMAGKSDVLLDIKLTDFGLLLRQLWDDKKIALRHLSTHDFINDSLGMPVSFERDAHGVLRLRCFENDVWVPVTDLR